MFEYEMRSHSIPQKTHQQQKTSINCLIIIFKDKHVGEWLPCTQLHYTRK